MDPAAYQVLLKRQPQSTTFQEIVRAASALLMVLLYIPPPHTILLVIVRHASAVQQVCRIIRHSWLLVPRRVQTALALVQA